jgi:hypothetical protein
MAGSSGTPLVKKLGLKPNHRLALLEAPPDFLSLLGDLPEGVTWQTTLERPPFDVMVLFVESRAALSFGFAAAAACLCETGGLWVAWPKWSSNVRTDLTEDIVRRVGLSAGLVDNKVCAIDDTWSGLRFVIRLRDRKN